MTEPQGWVLMGIFTTIMLGGFTFMSSSFARILRREIGTLRTELKSDITVLRSEMQTEFAHVPTEMQAEFAKVRGEIGALDRDVSTLMRREWGEPPET